jgi:hypothetical protein
LGRKGRGIWEAEMDWRIYLCLYSTERRLRKRGILTEREDRRFLLPGGESFLLISLFSPLGGKRLPFLSHTSKNYSSTDNPIPLQAGE